MINQGRSSPLPVLPFPWEPPSTVLLRETATESNSPRNFFLGSKSSSKELPFSIETLSPSLRFSSCFQSWKSPSAVLLRTMVELLKFLGLMIKVGKSDCIVLEIGPCLKSWVILIQLRATQTTISRGTLLNLPLRTVPRDPSPPLAGPGVIAFWSRRRPSGSGACTPSARSLHEASTYRSMRSSYSSWRGTRRPWRAAGRAKGPSKACAPITL